MLLFLIHTYIFFNSLYSLLTCCKSSNVTVNFDCMYILMSYSQIFTTYFRQPLAIISPSQLCWFISPTQCCKIKIKYLRWSTIILISSCGPTPLTSHNNWIFNNNKNTDSSHIKHHILLQDCIKLKHGQYKAGSMNTRSYMQSDKSLIEDNYSRDKYMNIIYSYFAIFVEILCVLPWLFL